MRASFLIAGMLLVYIVLGGIAAETGLTAPVVSTSVAAPQAPNQNAGFLQKLADAIAPLAWMFNAVAALFQLATFQSDNVPPLVNLLIFTPMGLVMLFAGIRLARGSG